LTALDNAAEGQRVFTVTVKSGDEVMKQIPLTAVVSGENAKAPASPNLRNALEIALIVLVVILVILGIIVGISKVKKDDEDFDEDEEKSDDKKTYY
jgi:hypothetical protein